LPENIAYQEALEPADQAESFKSPWLLWRLYRDPMHLAKERLDSEFMLVNYKWDLETLDAIMYDGPTDEDPFAAESEDVAGYNFNDYFLIFNEDNYSEYIQTSYFDGVKEDNAGVAEEDSILKILEEAEDDSVPISQQPEENVDEAVKTDYFTLDSLVNSKQDKKHPIIDVVEIFIAQLRKRFSKSVLKKKN
jgi:hypothetical protein